MADLKKKQVKKGLPLPWGTFLVLDTGGHNYSSYHSFFNSLGQPCFCRPKSFAANEILSKVDEVG
jgi:hypothetical protein